jgi:excisionase family DNA binding protein
MSEQGVTYQQVTVSEAAAILGVSVMTVRRMIKRGQLEGERVHRPQGTAYVVKLQLDAPQGTQDAPATEQPAENMSRINGTAPAPAEAMVSLIQTTIATVLGPLVAEQAALRQTVERSATRVAELERENGSLTAENAALRASQALPAWHQAPWWLWGVLGALSAAVVVLLAGAVLLFR